IRPVVFQIRISFTADVRATSPVMDVGRTRQGHLASFPHQRFEELQVAGVIGSFPVDALYDTGDTSRHAMAIGLVRSKPLALLGTARRTATNPGSRERLAIRAAAKFAISDHFKAYILLHLHGIADCAVFDRPQLRRIDASCREFVPCLQETGWSNEASYMLRP